jgi:hypothetical protein
MSSLSRIMTGVDGRGDGLSMMGSVLHTVYRTHHLYHDIPEQPESKTQGSQVITATK